MIFPKSKRLHHGYFENLPFYISLSIAFLSHGDTFFMEKRFDILHPLIILPSSIIAFFCIALYAYHDASVSQFLDFKMTEDVFIYAFLGLFFLLLGALLGGRYGGKFFLGPKIMIYLFLSVLIYDVLGIAGFVAVFFVLLFSDVIRREYYVGFFSKILLAIGIIFGALCFYFLGGIPLFNMALRGNAHNGFFIVSNFSYAAGMCFLMPSLSRRKAYVLLFFSGLFFSLWGYRNDVFEIVAMGIFVMYYTRKLSLGGLILMVSLFFSILLILGTYQTESTGQAWRIDNPLSLLLYRFGFTLGIFSKITANASLRDWVTRGILWHISGLRPTVLVGKEIAGYEAKINSTIFGPSLFDGGILELALVFLAVGFIMGYLSSLKKSDYNIAIYGFALAIVLGTVEIGFYFYDMIIISVAFFLALPRISEIFPILDLDQIKRKIFNS